MPGVERSGYTVVPFNITFSEQRSTSTPHPPATASIPPPDFQTPPFGGKTNKRHRGSSVLPVPFTMRGGEHGAAALGKRGV